MKKALKIYISVDMEGMAGITSPSQERDEVPSFRRALHNQVRWIIEGIHASSRNDEIGEITISDSHGSGDIQSRLQRIKFVVFIHNFSLSSQKC